MTVKWQRLNSIILRPLVPGLLVATLGAALTGCGGTTDQRPAENAIELSEEHTRALLRREIRDRGFTPPLAQELAASYWRSGRLDSSRAYLELAVDLDPLYVPSLTWLSRLHYEQGEISAGIELLEPIVGAMAVPDPELLANLSVLRLAWGDVSVAEELLLTCQDTHPHYAPAYGNLGYLYLQLGDMDRAEIELREAIEQDATVPEFHNNLGIVYRRSQQFKAAAQEFARAIKLEPDFREAHHNLALLYKLYLFDDNRARVHFRSFLALGGRPDTEVSNLFRRVEESP